MTVDSGGRLLCMIKAWFRASTLTAGQISSKDCSHSWKGGGLVQSLCLLAFWRREWSHLIFPPLQVILEKVHSFIFFFFKQINPRDRNFLFMLWFPEKKKKKTNAPKLIKPCHREKSSFHFCWKGKYSKMNLMYVVSPATLAQVSRQSQQRQSWRIRKETTPFGTKTSVNTCWLWPQIASVLQKKSFQAPAQEQAWTWLTNYCRVDRFLS